MAGGWEEVVAVGGGIRTGAGTGVVVDGEIGTGAGTGVELDKKNEADGAAEGKQTIGGRGRC
jgi:hypothetical protein